MRDWLDNRTGFRALLKHLLDEPLPSGVGWWFVTGSIVMFLLSVQLLTGVLLAIFYSPSPDHAYDSVRFIAEQVTDRKSTRLNSSHGYISYAVFCLKKKKNK